MLQSKRRNQELKDIIKSSFLKFAIFTGWLYHLSKVRRPCGRQKHFPVAASDPVHRMLGVGRDLQRSSGPTPLPKQDHIEQAAQKHIQLGFESL